MTTEIAFSKDIGLAFKNDPPGQWLLALPEGCIRLSSGYPEPALVPSEELKSAVVQLLEEEKDLPLQYIGSPRVLQLKRFIQKRLAERGAAVSDEELLVTSGACQAIDLISRVLLDDEAVVAVEAPTYMEALEVFKNYTDQFMDVPVDKDGLDTGRFAEMLSARKEAGLVLPRFLYTIPTYQNPTGTTLTLERRQHLLALAEEYDFIILEDDAYGELGFAGRPQLLKALDTNNRVVHIGSFSKVAAPGMRIGWAAGPKEIIKAMGWFKKDLSHPFAQASMAALIENMDFDEHLHFLTASYQSKYAAMIAALERFLPQPVSWYGAGGGYFIWVKIPGADTSEILAAALSNGVSFVPGKHFFLNPQKGEEFLRLSFSYANEEEIIQGIRLLGEAIRSVETLKEKRT